MDRIQIGLKIKELRKQRGWKQGTFATKAGIAPSYVPELENGKKCPTVETLYNICCAFGITLVDFFSDDTCAIKDKVSNLSDLQKSLLNDFLNSL